MARGRAPDERGKTKTPDETRVRLRFSTESFRAKVVTSWRSSSGPSTRALVTRGGWPSWMHQSLNDGVSSPKDVCLGRHRETAVRGVVPGRGPHHPCHSGVQSHGGTTCQCLRQPDEDDGPWRVSWPEETSALVSAVFDLAERRVSTVERRWVRRDGLKRLTSQEKNQEREYTRDLTVGRPSYTFQHPCSPSQRPLGPPGDQPIQMNWPCLCLRLMRNGPGWEHKGEKHTPIYHRVAGT